MILAWLCRFNTKNWLFVAYKHCFEFIQNTDER